MEKVFNEIAEVYSKYSSLHAELVNLEKQVTELNENRLKISKELEDTRLAEKILINKLEKSLDRKITQEDLIQIIRNHEK